jgi:catechol 2,3-dioxygenase-like lactoylglutathione lyase family enzyme
MNHLTYGLTHLAIAVRDIGRTLRFYQRVFDMQVMYHEKTMIQLTTPGTPDVLVFEQRDEPFAGQTGGIAHFGFRLRKATDFEAVCQKVVAAGAEIIDKGEFVPGSPYIFFKDPDGYIIEVWYELLPPGPVQ